MYGVFDRLLVLLCCCSLLPGEPIGGLQVAAFLVALTVAGLNGYLNSTRLRLCSLVLYTTLSAVWPVYCFFLPLMYYDAFVFPSPWQSLVILTALTVSFVSLPANELLIVALFMLLAYFLRQRTKTLKHTQTELVRLRDSSQEFSLLLQQKNKELIEKQDYEVRLATLNERNRIAREIHDHVGHLLSRSILQIGALIVTQPDKEVQHNLSFVRDTLANAMDSIRSSVHDLHADSINLEMQIKALATGFLFCPLRLDYRMENEPPPDIKFCFIAIVKEGLQNIMRHSQATQVTLTLLEHPALYQLLIQDNGLQAGKKMGEGLGLKNMAERVNVLGGSLTIEHEGGFRVFVSIPKER